MLDETDRTQVGVGGGEIDPVQSCRTKSEMQILDLKEADFIVRARKAFL